MCKLKFELLSFLLLGSVANAAPVVTVGIDLPTAVNSVPMSYGTDHQRVQLSASSNAYISQQSFLSSIPGAVWGLETFEEFKNYPVGLGRYVDVTGAGVTQQTPVIPSNGLTFAGTALTASVSDGGLTDGSLPLFNLPSQVIDVADPNAGFGRNNTTAGGSMFLTSGFSQSPNSNPNNLPRLSVLTLQFSSQISAFGFYINDLFDQGANTFVDVKDGGGNLIGSYNLFNLMSAVNPSLTAIQPPPPLGSPNTNTGDLGFFGFSLATADVKSIDIYSLGGETDIYGIDDIYVSSKTRQPPVVPEPSTLALAGMALAGVGLRFRRRKAA